MKRFELAVKIALFVLLSFSQTVAQVVTAKVEMDEEAIPGVKVVLIADNVKERTSTTDSSGTAMLDVSAVVKPQGHTKVQIVVRVCKDGKNVVYILQEGQQVPPEDQQCVNNKDCECKYRPAGFFLIRGGDNIRIRIQPEAVDVHVTSPEAGTASVAQQGTSPTIQLRGFGGATFVNGNSPSTAGFDGAVLFPIGHRVFAGPTAGFQWADSSVVSSIGSMTEGSTFANTSAGFKEGNFGGQIGFNLSGWELGVRGGATVASSAITEIDGFCGPTGCSITSSKSGADTVVGPFVGGYLLRKISPHAGIYVEGDYHHLKDGSIFDISVPDVVAGVVLTFSARRH